jgi:hypothetical protein
MAIFALGLYRFGWHDSATRFLVSVVPYPAAVVNATMISVDEYWDAIATVEDLIARQEAQVTNPDFIQFPTGDQVETTTLDRLVEQELIAQLVRKRDAIPSEADVEKARADLVVQLGGEEGLARTLQDTYGWTVDAFSERILVPFVNRIALENSVVRDTTITENAAAKQRATEVLALINAGTQPFEAIARDESDDSTTASNGGDLGYLRIGDLLGMEAFEDAVAQLEVGEISDVVQTRLGYHLIKLEERIAPDDGTADRVRVRHILFAGVDFSSWLAEQEAAARIYRFL